jgi:hypothetical protein
MGKDDWKDKDIRFRALEKLDVEKRKLQSAIIDKSKDILEKLHVLELNNLFMLEALSDLFQDWYLGIKEKGAELTTKDYQAMTNASCMIHDRLISYKKHILNPDESGLIEGEVKDTNELIERTEKALEVIKKRIAV